MSFTLARLLLTAGIVLSTGLARAEAPSGSTSSPPASQPSSTVACRLNTHKDRCVITPAPNDGLRIQFKGGDQAFFVFTPAGPPTTLNRKMKHAQGRLWLMSGHHSFTLREVGGFGNAIEVTSP